VVPYLPPMLLALDGQSLIIEPSGWTVEF
jgi:hypothetical protein